MTCRRAFDADILAVLHGDGDPELRAHAESCAECAAELRVWRELDGLLQAGATPPAPHPEPEALLAFVDAPATLASTAREAIGRHVADCRTCADEVRGLGAFDAAYVPAAVPAPKAGRWLGRILWHPALAYALVVLLLVPFLRDQMPKLRHDARPVDARRDAAPLPPASPRQERAQRAAPAPEQAPAANGRERAPSEGLALRKSADEEKAPRPQPAPAALADSGRVGMAAAPAAAPAAAGAVAADVPLVLALQAGKPTIFGAEALGRRLQLRVTPPADLASGPLDVTVRGRADRRQLTTRVPNRANAIAVDIPSDWLAAGDYVVTLQPLDDGARAAGVPVMLGFTVRAPAADR